MKILGAKGTYFPKSTINVEICSYRYDAECAVSQGTDTLELNSRYQAEMYGFRHNIQLTAWGKYLYIQNGDYAECEKSGKIRFDVYHQTDRWRDLSYSGSDVELLYPIIPDYYEAAWTQAGVDAFGAYANINVGDAKSTRYPNHGKQLYDLTGGHFGYDYTTGTQGSTNSQELYDLVDYELQQFYNVLGRKISSASYRNGQSGDRWQMISKYLVLRGSGSSYTGDSSTYYGQDKDGNWLGTPEIPFTRYNFISKNNATRWWDMWNGGGYTEQQASDYDTQEIQKTILNHGWFQDFIHWHNAASAGDVDALNRYFGVIDSAIGSNFVWRAAYGEIVEYLFFRYIIKRVSAFEGNGNVYIVLDKKDYFKGQTEYGIDASLEHLFERINTPLSVKIDLTGTSLEGKNIKTNGVGIRSLGSNQYIIDVDFSNNTEGGLQLIIEEETGTPDYYDFSKPSITGATVSGETLTIVTDKPTKCVVFVAERDADESTVTLLARSNELSTNHQIVLITANQAKDIYIGVITKEKQSFLSNVYQFS